MTPIPQLAGRGLIRLAAAAVLAAVVGGCSDGPATTADTPDVRASDVTPSDAAVVASSAPIDDPAITDAVEPGTTLAPPEALDELVPGLLTSEGVGVPGDWFILDLDPVLVDDPAFAGELDSFRGMVECPAGAVRSLDAPWLSRRFSVAETFLDNGVLSIEVIVHLDDAAGHAARIEALADCSGSGDGVEVVWSESVVTDDETPGAVGLTTDVLQITAEPDERTPFPYTAVATWLERSGFSVTAIVGGEPPADGWDAISERVAIDALSALEAG
jgi:hypothetical protein